MLAALIWILYFWLTAKYYLGRSFNSSICWGSILQTLVPSQWFILSKHRWLLYRAAQLKVKKKIRGIWLSFLSLHNGSENEVLFSGSSLRDTFSVFLWVILCFFVFLYFYNQILLALFHFNLVRKILWHFSRFSMKARKIKKFHNCC